MAFGMRQSKLGWLAISGLALGTMACNTNGGLFGDPDQQAAGNARPTVIFESVVGGQNDIQIDLIPLDDNNDPLSVIVQFSIDDGDTFRFATAASSSNPISDLTSGEVASFEWDSQADFQLAQISEAEVTLRAVPSDPYQEGYATIYGPFTVENTIVLTGGDGGGEDDEFANLDDVGGIATLDFDDDSGACTITLNAGTDSTRDNQEEEFVLIVGNNGEASTSYTVVGGEEDTEQTARTASSRASDPEHGVESSRGGTGRASARADSSGRQLELPPDRLEPPERSQFRQQVKEWARINRPRPGVPVQKTGPAAEDYVVGQTRQAFFVRSDLEDDSAFDMTTAVVGAVGDYVVIFVDTDVPIDWDFDCSTPEIDIPDSRKTYGFDTCDLSEVADIFDKNIVVHLHDYFGYESDLDGNGMITVLITPILNLLTTGSDSSDGEESSGSDGKVEVYVDPTVDLSPYDGLENPGSNYQEIIYLHAPDPGGYYNPSSGGGGEAAIEEYATVTMGANIAIATQKLISYNAHFLEGGGDEEADWLSDGLGFLAADLTGFGSVVYNDVAYYLDAPYYASLATENNIDDYDDRGFQYLLCRYLVDVYGEDILSKLMNGDATGIDNVEAAIQEAQGSDLFTFDDFMLNYFIALFMDGKQNKVAGGDLIDNDEVPPFGQGTTIPLGTTDYYGAEGYQQGININGLNYGRSRDGDGNLNEDFVIRLRGVGHTTYASGITYTGYVSYSYGVQYTRITGQLESSSVLKLTPNAGTLMGQVIRDNNFDPDVLPYSVEGVFGSLAADRIPLNVFEDGTESVGLGVIDEAQTLTLSSGSQVKVEDTDLYLIDLSEFSSSSATFLFQVVRSMASTSGGADLKKVMLAVAPAGDVPDPTNIAGSYECDGSEVLNIVYTDNFLPYLYYQNVLTPTSGTVSGFDPEGAESSDPTECNFDYDNEYAGGGILQNDEDEPKPTTLVDQILTYQVQTLGGTSSIPGFYPYSEAFLDWETTDGDDDPNYYFEEGLGGYNVEGGEEAILVVDLPAGNAEDQYILVVGGPSSSGAYELTARVLSDE